MSLCLTTCAALCVCVRVCVVDIYLDICATVGLRVFSSGQTRVRGGRRGGEKGEGGEGRSYDVFLVLWCCGSNCETGLGWEWLWGGVGVCTYTALYCKICFISMGKGKGGKGEVFPVFSVYLFLMEPKGILQKGKLPRTFNIFCPIPLLNLPVLSTKIYQ